VRRLERIYGAEPVRTEYDRLRAADQQQRAQIPAMS
jgi:hypothetical protein